MCATVQTPNLPVDTVIDRLREESLGLFGTSDIRADVRRLAVRPFSQVVELHVLRPGRPLTAFIKILKPRFDTPEELEATRRNVRREFDTLTQVHRALCGLPGLSTVHPIACYPDLLALVTQRLEGEPLTSVLSRLRGAPFARLVDEGAAVMRNVSAWLKAFQATGASGAPVSLDRMRAYLDARLRPLEELGVCSRNMRFELLRYFDRRAQEIGTSELRSVPVHADFTPENVIVGTGSVGVLDFTMAGHGARYLDLAHMFMQIDMLKARPWFRRTVIDRQTAALLSGYDRSLRPGVGLFELLLLQNVVCFLLHSARMTVPGLSARLLAQHVRRRHLRWLAGRARSA